MMDDRDHLDNFRCTKCQNLHELCFCEDEVEPEDTEFYKLAEEMFEEGRSKLTPLQLIQIHLNHAH